MLLTHLVLFSFLGGASASDAAPGATETPSGGWRSPSFKLGHFRGDYETEAQRRDRIHAERVRMGILPPDPTPPVAIDIDSGINRDTKADIASAGNMVPGLGAYLLPEDLAGLEALASRAAELTIDEELGRLLRYDEWLRDEDDAAVLLLAIATIH